MIRFASLSTVVETTFIVLTVLSLTYSQGITDPESTLDCHKRAYQHKVIQTDSLGRKCWDLVTVMSCWGRCDSNEISDWRFPYKRSYHPVCIHDERELRTAILTKCEEDVEPGTEVHEYQEALSCRCSLCRSSEANCEGLRYRGQRGMFGSQRG